MALRGRRIKYFLELCWLVGSGGFTIWVLSTSFQKSSIGWPGQPPTEKGLDISKKLGFDDPFHKKGRVLVKRMIQPFFWWNEAQMVKPLEPTSHHNSKKNWSFNPSELFTLDHFTIRHPVESNYMKKTHS